MSYLEPTWEEEEASNYFVRHWRGQDSLAWSYFINGGVVLTSISFLSVATVEVIESGGAGLQLMSALGVLWLIILLVAWFWGAVGIWRSAGNHPHRGGKAFWSTVAKIVVVLGAIGWVSQAHNLMLQASELGQLAMGHDPMGDDAALTLTGTDTLEINGIFTQGTASRVEAIIEAAPSVTKVVLNSIGGRLLEAERVGSLIRAKQLDTEVSGECSSACVMALLGGGKRTARNGSSIGLHQPSFPGSTPEDHAAGVAEAKEFYRRAGVEAGFVEQAMAATPDQMWYPDEAELIKARVLTGIGADRIIADHEKAARDLNDRAPIKLDDQTFLTSAKASETTLTYSHELKVPAYQVDVPVLRASLIKSVSKKLCSNSDIRRFIQNGAVYRYSYSDEAGRFLLDFSVREC